VGCGSTTESSSTTGASTSAVVTTTVPETTAPTTTTPETTLPTTLPPSDEPAVALYFVRGETLTVVGRSIGTWEITAVTQALLAGPTDAESADGVSTQIPAGTELLGATIDGNVATVDLTSAFESGGGSLSMTLRVAQVIYTLTQLPDVDVVQFRLDGEPREMIGGEGIIVTDASRASFEDGVLPGILLEQPFDRSPLTNPIVIGGMSNVFEATVNYQVLAQDGTVLVEGMTMALCGTGCWGGFTAEIPLPTGTTGPVTLRVFDYSEENGTTMLDLVEVTLT
jgi:germination protein M